MTEWSYPRSAWKAAKAKPAKELNKKVNAAHSAYLAGDITLEDYTDELYIFLEPGNSDDDVYGFLHTITAGLESGSFHPSDSRLQFSTALRRAWDAYQRDSATPTDQQERPAPIPADSWVSHITEDKGNFATIKYATNKAAVQLVYENYAAGAVEAEYALWQTVIKFGVRKTTGKLFDLPEAAVTAEDLGQEIAIYIWKNLSSFRGEAEAFYPWLHRIVDIQSRRGFSANLEESKTKVPFLVTMDDGSMKDNPQLYRDQRPRFLRAIPDFIKGTDLRIYQYIGEGMNYRDIAKVLLRSEAAVKQRVQKMRQRQKIESSKK
jgi:hypothetical protein